MAEGRHQSDLSVYLDQEAMRREPEAENVSNPDDLPTWPWDPSMMISPGAQNLPAEAETRPSLQPSLMSAQGGRRAANSPLGYYTSSLSSRARSASLSSSTLARGPDPSRRRSTSQLELMVKNNSAQTLKPMKQRQLARNASMGELPTHYASASLPLLRAGYANPVYDNNSHSGVMPQSKLYPGLSLTTEDSEMMDSAELSHRWVRPAKATQMRRIYRRITICLHPTPRTPAAAAICLSK